MVDQRLTALGGLTTDHAHRAQVERAVNEGEPVPMEVVRDYPDLFANVKSGEFRCRYGKRPFKSSANKAIQPACGNWEERWRLIVLIEFASSGRCRKASRSLLKCSKTIRMFGDSWISALATIRRP